MSINIRKIKAIETQNKKRWLALNPRLTDNSGIYFLTRKDEYGFKFAYIGQAKHILTRLASHLIGYQHIDISLKKHNLYSKTKNPYGWKVNFLEFPLSDLDEKEKLYIKMYALNGYQLRNKTIGGQGDGKKNLGESRPKKTYMQGLNQGYKNASKEVAHLFDLHLNYSKKSNKPNKNQEKAMNKFKTFLEAHKE